MAEPEDQRGFNQVDGKIWSFVLFFGFFSTEMPQVLSAAEPAEDSVVTG